MRKNIYLVSAVSALLSFFTAAPMAAESVTAPPVTAELRTIEVSGHGEARSTPDTALLDIAIETHGTTAEEASTQNAALSQKVTKALKDKLGDKGKIYTGGYNLFPDYDQRPQEGRPRITGYRADNSINIETSALDQLGTLIDTAIAAGANRVNSLNLSLRDDSGARSEAIGKATKDAQTQAQALANSAGVKLKRIVQASTVAPTRPIPIMGRAMPMAEMAAPTPIQVGEVTVPATVSLVYEIE